MKKLFACFLALASAAAFGTTTVPVQLLNPTGSTAGQAIVSTGSASAPGWSTLGLSGLSAISANTLIGNATGSSATPTAVSVTGCNGAAQALQWTSGSGFGCNSNVATAGANANITSLTGLTTPLGTWAGGLGANNSAANGVPIFSAGAATVTAATGTGSPVLATSPTITTPTLTGTTSGACASAGNIGECKQSSVPIGTAVSVSNNTATTVTSVSLTAGNWLCSGNVFFGPNAATVTSAEAGWISSTAPPSIPTTPNSGSYAALNNLSSTAGGNANAMPVGEIPINVTTTTTVYLVAYATFTTNTMAAYGAINCFRWH